MKCKESLSISWHFNGYNNSEGEEEEEEKETTKERERESGGVGVCMYGETRRDWREKRYIIVKLSLYLPSHVR